MPAISNTSNFRATAPVRAPVSPPKAPPPMADRPHGSGTISQPRAAPSRPASAYVAPAPKAYVPDVRPHGAGTLTKVTPGFTRPTSTPDVSSAAEKRHAAALALMSQAHHLGTKLGGPSISLANEAAITAAHLSHPDWASFLKPAAGVLGHLGTDLVTLPQSTIQSLWEGGKALTHDVTHNPLGLAQMANPVTAVESALGHGPKNLATAALVHSAAQNDPLFQLTTLHPAHALHLAEAHPLTAITDVGSAGALLGRAAGLGARSLGIAKHLEPLKRPALELPGGITPVARRYSGNRLTAIGQHQLDLHGNPLARIVPRKIKLGGIEYPIRGFEREMYRRANEHQLVMESMSQRAEQARRQNPITGPGAKPIEQQVKEARREAERVALMDTIRQNALTNPRTGDIFYSGKNVPRLYTTHLGPGKMTREMQRLADEHGTEFVRRTLPGAYKRKGGPVSVVIPKTLHDTISAHRAIGSEHVTFGGKLWRFGTQRFRRTVLPYSTKWIMGNTSEASLRSILRGVSPQHVALGGSLTKTMRENGLFDQADRLEAQALQGTHFSFQKREAAKYTSEHPVAAVRGLGRVTHYAGLPADKIFAGNQALEQQFAHAVLGKHASDYLRHIKREFPNISKQERMDLLAKVYAKPEVAAHAGRFGRDVLGQYAAFGPHVNKFVHNYAPFAPWYGNAARFMGTLPFKHPIATNTALNITAATKKQWEKEHKSVSGLGGDLMSFPMTGKYKALDIGRYLPPGAFSAGVGLNPLDAAFADAGQAILPQVSDAVRAFSGLDPFGKPLEYPGPEPGKRLKNGKLSKAHTHYAKAGTPHLPIAVSDILASMLGPTQTIQRIAGDRGGTPYSGTNFIWDPSPPLKYGGHPLNLQGILAGLNKVLNPLKPIDLKPHKAKKSTSAWGGISGGQSSSGGAWGGFK